MRRASIDHLRAADRPLVYAHRGASARAPENTLAAFALAFEEGADGIELDVRRCASGELVVIHDPDLLRVAGVADRVADLDYPRLRRHDVGAGEHVPLLDEALDLALGHGGLINVEVKPGGGTQRDLLVDTVSRSLARRDARAQQRILLSTFDPKLLASLQVARPRAIPMALLFDLPHTGLERAESLLTSQDPEGAHPQIHLAQPERVRAWQTAGRFVNAWTLNTAEEWQAARAAGVDGVITDCVREARQLLSEPTPG